MGQEQAVIVGIGLMSAVGLSAPETAASVRAGTMRFRQIEWRDHRYQRYTLATVIDEALPDAEPGPGRRPTYREDRMLRLAARPLLEALGAAGARGPISVDLALPEHDTTMPLDAPLFLQRLARHAGGRLDLAGSDAGPRGRAGGLLAIAQACGRIAEGKARFALAGGVDTYLDLYVLGMLDAEKRIKSSKHLDGFIPGEGAGFVLLAARGAADAAGMTPLAAVSPVGQATEEGHLYSQQPYRGDGLAGAFQDLFAQASGIEPVREVYSSMNGENHWAREWGVAFMRGSASFAPGHGMHHPADCMGDTGAACGPIMAGLAALGIAGGYRKSPCLVYASSDRGPRAAVLLTAP